MTGKKALDCAEALKQFCKEQDGCQNCIFRKFGPDHWYCHIGEPAWWFLEDVPSCIERKKQNHGYL